jgi:subtilisin family serine protease
MRITVYVIDSGIDPKWATNDQIIITTLQEFRTLRGSIRWHFLPNQPHRESDPTGHGTCVASKIAGPVLGVAKNANLVIVKAVQSASRFIYVSHFVAAWAVVARDIETAGLSGRAAIITSIGWE